VKIEFEEYVRLRAFEEIRSRQQVHGEVLPLDVLQQPVRVENLEISLIAHMRGIHKPSMLRAALAVLTVAPKKGAPAPYDDRFDVHGSFRYHYRDPGTEGDRARLMADSDNQSLRVAMDHRLPIIYYIGIIPGRYLPIFPTYVIDDHPNEREFSLDMTGFGLASPAFLSSRDDVAAEVPDRAYRAQVVMRRIHQAQFRQRVMTAYRSHCAICRLKRPELVEAAHIVPDSLGGPAIVSNGMAMCKLHHAAFDRHILGIRPDLTVAVRGDVLDEVDGPMLAHGLKDFHNQPLLVTPSVVIDRPGVDFLEQRWSGFLAA
jgi:putative restriction endonuclease